jgi:uncharacterized membrane protein (UPF0127 family)
VKAAPLAIALLALAGCGDAAPDAGGAGIVPVRIVPVRITGAGGDHLFQAEVAGTQAEQARGLMFRTDLTAESAMLFAPYPSGGGEPREASFWMKNTPSALDIVFIRPDGTIARIAENTVPFSEAPVSSGEPVSAVLELRGGRASELGIAEGDMVTWPKTGAGTFQPSGS